MAGVLMLTAGHVLAKALARTAIMIGIADLASPQWLARLLAWVSVAVATGLALHRAFAPRALMPAFVAAAMVPLLYGITFLRFFGVERGLPMAIPLLFETAVVFLALPGTVALTTKSNRGQTPFIAPR